MAGCLAPSGMDAAIIRSVLAPVSTLSLPQDFLDMMSIIQRVYVREANHRNHRPRGFGRAAGKREDAIIVSASRRPVSACSLGPR